MTAAETELKRRHDAAQANKNIHYRNETIAETETVRLEAFSHTQGTRYTIRVKTPDNPQWQTALMGYNQALAFMVFDDLSAGKPMPRISNI